VAEDLRSLGTRVVLFSGGEPLLRPDVMEAAERFARHGIRRHLHTSGLHLERAAPDVARLFERVIVSLDAPSEQTYQAIRGVAALAAVERGVARLRRLAPSLPVTARTTVHRLNFRQLPTLIEHARAMSLDGISFLAADVSSAAFGRRGRGDAGHGLALTAAEIADFTDAVETTIAERADDFASGFVAESPDKLRRLPHYYAALAGYRPFPPVACNAPEVSIVIVADGAVRPCFFHRAIGSVRERRLAAIVRDRLPAFRREWSVATDPICTKCVCAIRTTWRSAPWH
jgi:MoaA/NifB/PqqE/SkfB family radical SAM enzyme